MYYKWYWPDGLITAHNESVYDTPKTMLEFVGDNTDYSIIQDEDSNDCLQRIFETECEAEADVITSEDDTVTLISEDIIGPELPPPPKKPNS